MTTKTYIAILICAGYNVLLFIIVRLRGIDEIREHGNSVPVLLFPPIFAAVFYGIARRSYLGWLAGMGVSGALALGGMLYVPFWFGIDMPEVFYKYPDLLALTLITIPINVLLFYFLFKYHDTIEF